MPIVRIETSVDPTRISPTLAPDLIAILCSSKAMSTAGKRVEDFAVSIVTTPNIYLRCSRAPCALVDVTSIGGLGVQENEELSKIMVEVICPGLGIDAAVDRNRIIICFHDVGPHEIGHAEGTFHKVVGN